MAARRGSGGTAVRTADIVGAAVGGVDHRAKRNGRRLSLLSRLCCRNSLSSRHRPTWPARSIKSRFFKSGRRQALFDLLIIIMTLFSRSAYDNAY